MTMAAAARTQQGEEKMGNMVMDFKGLKCPQPVLKLAIKANTVPKGTTVEVHADCTSFPNDVKKWCADTGRVLINCMDKGGGMNVATIQF
jgi:tRNA 2-thiouridine synthesizing protein A